MNRNQALAVEDLAKPCYEALKKISKRVKLGVRIKLEEWKWEPEVGEWVLAKHFHPQVRLIAATSDGWAWTAYRTEEQGLSCHSVTGDCIPILHWERIEEILEGMGYYLQMNKPLDVSIEKGTMKVGCSIYQTGKDDFITFAQAKSRQEVVMLAVIELGKGIK